MSAVDWISQLEPWRAAGVLNSSDLQVAASIARRNNLGASDAEVVLAMALAARAPRTGHSCLDLENIKVVVSADIESDDESNALLAALEWPVDSQAWARKLAESSVVVVADVLLAADGSLGNNTCPFVLNGSLLYLERYWYYEREVARQLFERVSLTPLDLGEELQASTDLLASFKLTADQDAAVHAALSHSLSVIVGGPGTGKTRTVGALLALLLSSSTSEGPDALRIALAAPTGKAASRMGEAIEGLAASLRTSGLSGAGDLADRMVTADTKTLHSLLGARPGSTRYRFNAANPLPHNVVIVDETSMVSLPLMAHLLDALNANARIVLVGDPGQLASVDAGSVLGDIASPVVEASDLAVGDEPYEKPAGELSSSITVLRKSHRFAAESSVGRFAKAVRRGNTAEAINVLTEPQPPSESDDAVRLVWHSEQVDGPNGARHVRDAAFAAAVTTRKFAEEGNSSAALEALSSVRILCAHRRGPFGVARWNWQFEDWLAGKGTRLSGFYIGRPLLVTTNDSTNKLHNGDLGVVVRLADGTNRVAFVIEGEVRDISTARLESVETVHAMTIHKSQGSEFDQIVVVLPPTNSRLATRELLYTAVTRARKTVTIIGSKESLENAINNQIVRSSGLRSLLWN